VAWRCNNGDPAKRIPGLLVGQDELGFDELRDSGRFRQGQAGEQELDRELADGAGVTCSSGSRTRSRFTTATCPTPTCRQSLTDESASVTCGHARLGTRASASVSRS